MKKQSSNANNDHKSNQPNSNNTTLDHNNSAYKSATDNHSVQLNSNTKKGK